MFLDEVIKKQVPTEKVIKGYKVNVSYDAGTMQEMNRKRASVAQVVLTSLKKQKQKS